MDLEQLEAEEAARGASCDGGDDLSRRIGRQREADARRSARAEAGARREHEERRAALARLAGVGPEVAAASLVAAGMASGSPFPGPAIAGYPALAALGCLRRSPVLRALLLRAPPVPSSSGAASRGTSDEDDSLSVRVRVRLAVSGELLPEVADLRPTDTLASLRLAIGRITGQRGTMSLVLHGRVLRKDHMSLAALGISDGSEVSVVRKPADLALTLADDGVVKLWRAQSGECLHMLDVFESVRSATFSPDGERVLVVPRGVGVSLWSVESGELVTALVHEGTVRSAAFSSGGHVVTASERGAVSLWGARQGGARTLPACAGEVLAAHLSPDGNWLLTLSADDEVRLWDIRKGECVQTLEADRHAPLAFASDGLSFLLTRNHAVEIWGMGRRVCLRQTLQGHRSDVLSCVFSCDSALVLTSSTDRTARVWPVCKEAPGSVPQLTNSQLLLQHKAPVFSARLSANGDRILTVTLLDARLWRAADGKLAHVLLGHAGPVLSAEFSGDGFSVITASEDATAKLWDVESGECVQTLEGSVAALTYAQLL